MGGWVLLWKMREMGKGVGEGGGWGRDTERNQQVKAHAFVKTTGTTLLQTTLWQNTL